MPIKLILKLKRRFNIFYAVRMIVFGRHLLYNGNILLRRDGNMISKSPSGALCPYYYKGGYFHGIHYESYFDDMNSFLDMVGKEEEFILLMDVVLH